MLRKSILDVTLWTTYVQATCHYKWHDMHIWLQSALHSWLHAWRLYWLLAIACWVSGSDNRTSVSADCNDAGTRSGSCLTAQLWEETELRCSRRTPSLVATAHVRLLHPVSAERGQSRHHFLHECDDGADDGGGDVGDGDADDVSLETTPTPVTRCRIAFSGDGAYDGGGGEAFGNCFPCEKKKLL